MVVVVYHAKHDGRGTSGGQNGWRGSGRRNTRAKRPRSAVAGRSRQLQPLALSASRLCETCEPQPDPPRVEALLAACRPSLESLGPWSTLDPTRYTRRRLFSNEAFELLLLCWDRGQKPPVHDHAGQAGWFTVPEGNLGVQEFERVGGATDLGSVTSAEATPPGSLPLVAGRRLTVPAGSGVAEAAAPETIHGVGPERGRALSLHLYAGPLNSFLVFDPERGTASASAREHRFNGEELS